MKTPYAHSLPPGHGPDRPTPEEREAQPHGYECDRCGGVFRQRDGDFHDTGHGYDEFICEPCWKKLGEKGRVDHLLAAVFGGGV